MDVYKTRYELRNAGKRHLFRLVFAQKISECLIGGQVCGLYLHYKGFNFCVSEIMGEGCELEKSVQLQGTYQEEKEINGSFPLLDRIGIRPLPPGKKAVAFRVYCRDHVTHATTFLGTVIERRKTERGNNLNDLLVKAVKDYSGYVADPSTIFLLSL
jgi:hypothetical protein